MIGLAGMITGLGQVWVLSGLRVTRLTATLGCGAGPGRATRGEEGRGGRLGRKRVSAL
jgi:hypothetical protein